jgi:hypothetical protein
MQKKSLYLEEKFVCGARQLMHLMFSKQFGLELPQLQVIKHVFLPVGSFVFYYLHPYLFIYMLDLIMQKLINCMMLFLTERLWSPRDSTSAQNVTLTALPRLKHFRCLLNGRGVPAAPVTNYYGRRAPDGPGSCYNQ